MTLPDKILNFADEFDMLPESSTVLACVSGGADSMCLLEVLLDISGQRGFAVYAAHYNHKLRGEESDRDEAFVRDYCSERGITFRSGCGDVRVFAENHGSGIEAAARDLRYDFFHYIAKETGAKRIATAHTADDNTETMILNLVRGAGKAGLAGIPPKRGYSVSGTRSSKRDDGVMIVRPMLRVSREDVLLFLSARGIPYVEDSSNSLDVFTRNRLRHSVIPVLKEINPRLNDAAAAAAEIARADEEYLSGIAESVVNSQFTIHDAQFTIHDAQFTIHDTQLGDGDAVAVDVKDLLQLPFAVSSRVIIRLCGGNLSYDHVNTVLDLCRSESASASLSLPGMTVYKEYGRIMFKAGRRQVAGEFEPVSPVAGECVCIPGTGLKMSCKTVVCSDTINKSFTSFLFNYDGLCGKICVRPRREGDIIRLFGRNGSKTLKKLFIERQIPVRKRGLIPVVSDDYGVLAVYGVGMGDRALPGLGELALLIDFEEEP